ncbi:rCG57150 [Rattus norvegicus]|uniref:RCG57150 n=1 Tax=Rattus norvegicus TaxID=10116 RepID=A6JDC4_RAT|nr:rCG57150 [Rattus norvegicus]
MDNGMRRRSLSLMKRPADRAGSFRYNVTPCLIFLLP